MAPVTKNSWSPIPHLPVSRPLLCCVCPGESLSSPSLGAEILATFQSSALMLPPGGNFCQDHPRWKASQVVLVVKNLPAKEGDKSDMGSIPGWGRSPGGGHGNPLQHSCLENPMERGAWRATVHGAAKSQTRLKQLTHPQAAGERNSFLLSGSQPPLSTALSDPTPVHVTLQGRQASSQNQMEMRPLKFSVPGTVHGLQRGRRTEELQLSFMQRVWTLEVGRSRFESCLCHYCVTLGKFLSLSEL